MFKKLSDKLNKKIIAAKIAMMNKSGEAYMSDALKIVIAVVIGIVLLVLLYTLFTNVIGVSVVNTIKNLFSQGDNIANNVGNYSGVS